MDQFADMVTVECLKRRVADVLIKRVVVANVMEMTEKRHPDHFLERFGAFGGDVDAIGMGAFDSHVLFARGEIDKAVPEPRGENRRIIAILMGGGIGMLGKGFKQDCTA